MQRSPQIIKLPPPRISKDTILQEIVCTRPMQEGKFNISLKKKGSKTIINCYGHGGAGWTTLFGSVKAALQLLEKSSPSKTTPIHVIGSGCIGLTTAIELQRSGYNVKAISTKSLYDGPSWKAAGYFALVSTKTSPEEQMNLNEIGLDTFLIYQKIANGKHPYLSSETLKFMPVFSSVDTIAGVEDLEERGLLPSPEYVTLDFGGNVIHEGFVKHMTYFMNTTALMRQLHEEIKKLGILLRVQEIESFDDLEEEIVFNCAGLGGSQLDLNENMIPVRGHLVTLNPLAGAAHLDYMIYTKVKQEGREEYIYLFPKSMSVTAEFPQGLACNGVLGGTFIPHVDKLSLPTQKNLDQTEFQRLKNRNSQFFQGHPF